MKKAIIIIFCGLLMLTACSKKPRTEITSATIEAGIGTSGGITQIIDGYRPARIDFIVYDFEEIPSVDDAADYKQVTEWLVNYAHCYQNGEELERSYYYHFKDEFKKGKQCKITVFYQIPDDGEFQDLSFRFDLKGFEFSYDSEFTNNVK